jgi:hypothetical protein
MDQALEILKWVGIVLAAGFIGYFGRYLAMVIIERARRRKTQELPGDATSNTAPSVQSNDANKDSYKLEKQRLKVEKKRIKKSNK